nr:MAG TPA: hypothetical protein [Caudoviricetes sp.]
MCLRQNTLVMYSFYILYFTERWCCVQYFFQ